MVTCDVKECKLTFLSLNFVEIHSSLLCLHFFYLQDSSGSELDEEECMPIGGENLGDEEEPEQGTSEIFRSMECTKRGNPATSTPSSKNRPSFSRSQKRRRLLSIDALHSREVSHISESPRSVSSSPVPISFVLNSPVSPDRSVSLNNRSVSPNNRSVSPSHRSISPVSSVSPDRSASLSSQGRGVKGQRVRGPRRGMRGRGRGGRGRGSHNSFVTSLAVLLYYNLHCTAAQ